MTKIDEKKINDTIHSIGLNNFLVDSEVRKIVESQFRFTYETIKNLNLEQLTDEEIENTKTNFTYKHIGKLFTSPDIIKRNKLRTLIIKQKKNEQQDF